MATMTPVESPRLDAKLLYRRLDSLFGTLDARRSIEKVLRSFLEQAFETLRDDLRLGGAALFREGRDAYRLAARVGEPGEPLSETLPADSPPLVAVQKHGVFIFPDPWAEGSPQRLGLLPARPLAGLAVGRRGRRSVFFLVLEPGWVYEELDFALNTIRAALGSRLRDERVAGSYREAAEIQQSLLLEEPPEFGGFEIACRTQPAEEVGGDLYDFLPLDADSLGIAIGDASGHGLPAALLVRDVVTGLRMGVERDLKLSAVLARLNRVIHQSKLSSRFVSVFYAELERNGNLFYVNAGHQPPLLVSGGRVERLEIGGTVIGPLPQARFERGFAHLAPGDLLVSCTDGILERRDPAGEFFGEERLLATIGRHPRAGAEDLVEAVFAATDAFGAGRPFDDDATLVVVKRGVRS